MTHPTTAKIQYPPLFRQEGVVVLTEVGDGVVVDVRYEAGCGVEGGVGGGVVRCEVGGGVREGGVGVCGGVGVGRVG